VQQSVALQYVRVELAWKAEGRAGAVAVEGLIGGMLDRLDSVIFAAPMLPPRALLVAAVAGIERGAGVFAQAMGVRP
jgi:hypothetical protein